MVQEQDETIVVEVDGKYNRLGFTVPARRVGSSAWFNNLQGILEKYGLTSDNGLLALFFGPPSDAQGGQGVLSHVDDVEVSAKKNDFEKLVKFRKDAGLNIKVERPLDVDSGSMSFMKRVFRSMGEGIVEITRTPSTLKD